MVAPLQSNYSIRKGIYRDLYNEIDSDNKKKSEIFKKDKPRGIYAQLYKQLEREYSFKSQRDEQQVPLHILIVGTMQKMINHVFSKVSYFFSGVGAEIKPLLLAVLVAKKPINNYIDNNINYSNQGYHND